MANEMGRCVGAITAGIWRYETSGEITIVDAAAEPVALAKWPLGTCTLIDGKTLAAAVQRTGRPAVKMFVPQRFYAGLCVRPLMSRDIADSGSQARPADLWSMIGVPTKSKLGRQQLKLLCRLQLERFQRTATRSSWVAVSGYQVARGTGEPEFQMAAGVEDIRTTKPPFRYTAQEGGGTCREGS